MHHNTDLINDFFPTKSVFFLLEYKGLSFFLFGLKKDFPSFGQFFSFKGVVFIVSMMHMILAFYSRWNSTLILLLLVSITIQVGQEKGRNSSIH